MSAQTLVYLVRHGECAGNAEKRIRGRVDFPLNETGKLQAQAASVGLSEIHLDFVYSSPLVRALETAETIAKPHGLPVSICEAFTNMSFGVWDNRKKSELASEDPVEWEHWLNNTELLRVKDGETVDEVKQRSFAALNKLVRKHEGKAILIVSHREVLRPMLAAALGISSPYMWRIHLDNASCSCLSYTPERGYTLMKSNDTSHMKNVGLLNEYD